MNLHADRAAIGIMLAPNRACLVRDCRRLALDVERRLRFRFGALQPETISDMGYRCTERLLMIAHRPRSSGHHVSDCEQIHGMTLARRTGDPSCLVGQIWMQINSHVCVRPY